MAFPRVRVRKTASLKWYLILIYILCMTCAGVLLYYSKFIQMYLDTYRSTLSWGIEYVISVMLFATVIICVVLNGITVRSLARRENNNFNPETKFVHVVSPLLAGVLIVCFALICIRHSNNVTKSIEGGIREAMKSYRNDGTLKKQMDLLQIDFQCCGVDSYKDWFHEPWYREANETVKQSNAHAPSSTSNASVANDSVTPRSIVADGVPFSCCKIDELRPCVHYGLAKVSDVYSFDPGKDLTVNVEGCLVPVAKSVQRNFRCIALLLLVAALLEFTLAALARLLQTSQVSAREGKDQDGYLTSWIFGSKP